MSDNGISKLNPKEITTRIASDTLGFIFAQARGDVASKMIEVAKSWGANIPEEAEAQFKNQIADLFSPPTAWPAVEITVPPVVGGVTHSATVAANTKAPGRAKKQGSDRATTNTRKAGDFRALVVPSGMAIPKCPALMKSGDKKSQACGKECKRVTDNHDTSNPECARLECGHFYCGTHIVKASETTGGATSRLNSSADPEQKPIVYNQDGDSTSINATAVGNVDKSASSAAGKEAMARLMAKMKEKEKAKQAKESENP